MNHQTFLLREYFPKLPEGETPATITSYCSDLFELIDRDKRFPALVIFPGGGYRFTSDREAEPVAQYFLAAGFQTFVVRYNVAPSRFPTQLLEAAAAIAFVRDNADIFHIDPTKVGVLGFSAGGHVAASIGTLFGASVITNTLSVTGTQCRPDALLLSYPVITLGEYAHKGSRDNLVGEQPEEALLQMLSLENAVSPQTPPVFLWHTYEDTVVPVENSLFFAAALRKNGVPLELHIFEWGPHGLALCDTSTAPPEKPALINEHAGNWKSLSVSWLKKRFGIL